MEKQGNDGYKPLEKLDSSILRDVEPSEDRVEEILSRIESEKELKPDEITFEEKRLFLEKERLNLEKEILENETKKLILEKDKHEFSIKQQKAEEARIKTDSLKSLEEDKIRERRLSFQVTFLREIILPVLINIVLFITLYQSMKLYENGAKSIMLLIGLIVGVLALQIVNYVKFGLSSLKFEGKGKVR